MHRVLVGTLAGRLANIHIMIWGFQDVQLVTSVAAIWASKILFLPQYPEFKKWKQSDSLFSFSAH